MCQWLSFDFQTNTWCPSWIDDVFEMVSSSRGHSISFLNKIIDQWTIISEDCNSLPSRKYWKLRIVRNITKGSSSLLLFVWGALNLHLKYLRGCILINNLGHSPSNGCDESVIMATDTQPVLTSSTVGGPSMLKVSLVRG